jgi:large subunit ribosomal protein L31
MKTNIHPVVFTDAQVICSCGNTFTTTSTKKHITVEVCSKCHPFYTGEHRFIDTQGKVERFKQKQRVAAQMREKLINKKSRKKSTSDESRPKTLKELLDEV